MFERFLIGFLIRLGVWVNIEYLDDVFGSIIAEQMKKFVRLGKKETKKGENWFNKPVSSISHHNFPKNQSPISSLRLILFPNT